MAHIPWCCVNSIYYFGEDAARALEDDFVGAAPYFIRQLRALLADANLVLHGTDIEFDPPPPSLPSHHHYVGPLLWEPPGEVPSFLTEPGAPWVLVSLSSLPQADELTLARAALQVLAEQRVRVVLTLPETHPREKLGAIPTNARLAHYIPHTEVLKHSCLLVSHSGHGIVTKALSHGVPMVLVPWGRDQPGVAARAAALGVAHVVHRAEFVEREERLGIAIRQVLETPSYREQTERVAQRLRAHDAVADACARIVALVANSDLSAE
jgi:MGT family glycosyltransferase